MQPKDKTAAKRTKALRGRYKAQGFVPVHVWAHPDAKRQIRDLAAESRKATEAWLRLPRDHSRDEVSQGE